MSSATRPQQTPLQMVSLMEQRQNLYSKRNAAKSSDDDSSSSSNDDEAVVDEDGTSSEDDEKKDMQEKFTGIGRESSQQKSDSDSSSSSSSQDAEKSLSSGDATPKVAPTADKKARLMRMGDNELDEDDETDF